MMKYFNVFIFLMLYLSVIAGCDSENILFFNDNTNDTAVGSIKEMGYLDSNDNFIELKEFYIIHADTINTGTSALLSRLLRANKKNMTSKIVPSDPPFVYPLGKGKDAEDYYGTKYALVLRIKVPKRTAGISFADKDSVKINLLSLNSEGTKIDFLEGIKVYKVSSTHSGYIYQNMSESRGKPIFCLDTKISGSPLDFYGLYVVPGFSIKAYVPLKQF